MDRGERAVRQLERMLPEVARQHHLRATDPERYEEHMASLQPPVIDETNSRLIATEIYDSQGRRVRIERADQVV